MNVLSHFATLFVGVVIGLGAYAYVDANDDAEPVGRERQDTRWAEAAKDPAKQAAAPATRASLFRPSVQAHRRDDSEHEEEVEALSRDLDRLEDQLEREKNGVIQEWPALTAENEIYQPAQFEENLNAVLEACDLQMEHFSLSCDEPPCIAAIRGPKTFKTWQEVLACPEWAKRGYPLEAMALETEIQCPDSEKESAFFISPYWRDYLEETPELKTQRDHRTQKRWGEMYPSLCDEES